MLPPGLRLRRERDDLPERVAGLATEAEVRALAEDYNARVEAFWRLPAESSWAAVPGLADVEALVEGWLRDRPAAGARAGGPPRGAAPAEVVAPAAEAGRSVGAAGAEVVLLGVVLLRVVLAGGHAAVAALVVLARVQVVGLVVLARFGHGASLPPATRARSAGIR